MTHALDLYLPCSPAGQPLFPWCGPLVNCLLTLEILAHMYAKLFSPEFSSTWNVFPELC